jgi:hypothetical protein
MQADTQDRPAILMPIAAAVVAVIGIAILLMDLSARSEVESKGVTGITMITSAVVTRAGATMLPTEPAAR